jgi:hypothetical protein
MTDPEGNEFCFVQASPENLDQPASSSSRVVRE